MVACFYVYSAARNSASSRNILTIVKSARCHCVINAQKCSSVPSAPRHSASIVKSTAGVKCARRYSVTSAKTLSSVKTVRHIPSVLSARKICSSVISATRQPVPTAKCSTTAKCARRNSVVSAKALSTVKSATSRPALNAKMCSYVRSVIRHSAKIPFAVKSATSGSAALSARILSTVKSATSVFVATARTCSYAKSVMSHSALIVELPSPTANANQTSVLVAERRFLQTMNASISVAASGAKRDMLAVVRKARCFIPKRRKYLALGRLAALGARF
jgi:hypothetical protein